MWGKILQELLEALYRAARHPLTIVETGTLYYDTLEAGEKNLLNRSTFAVSDWIKKNGGAEVHTFHSVDFSPGHIETSKRIMAANGFNGIVQHHLGDGTDVLRNFDFPMDFVILDTAVESEYTLSEYIAIREKMRTPGIIVIDDTFVQIGKGCMNKGRLALPESERDLRRNWTRIKKGTTQNGETLAAIAFGVQSEQILQSIPEWFESTLKPQR